MAQRVGLRRSPARPVATKRVARNRTYGTQRSISDQPSTVSSLDVVGSCEAKHEEDSKVAFPRTRNVRDVTDPCNTGVPVESKSPSGVRIAPVTCAVPLKWKLPLR